MEAWATDSHWQNERLGKEMGHVVIQQGSKEVDF